MATAPRHCARRARRWRRISLRCRWSFAHPALPDRGLRHTRCAILRWVVFSKPSVRRAIAVGAVLLVFAAACSRGDAAHTVVSDTAQTTQAPDPPALAPVAVP